MYSIEITQDEVTAALTTIADVLDDLTPVMDVIGAVLVNRIRSDFDKSQDPYGNPWAPLKLRAGQPLIDTGVLRNSITHQPEPGAVEIGTNVAYAPVHQFGATVKAPAVAGNVSIGGYVAKGSPLLRFTAGGRVYFAKQVVIPARPMFPSEGGGLPQNWSDDVLDVLNGYFLEHASAA